MTDTAARTESSTPFTELVDQLRTTYRSGRTRTLDWRKEQLKGILRLLDENDAELTRALAEDLGRPSIEAYACDLGFTKAEVSYLLKHVGSWMKPKRVMPGLTSLPGKGRIVPEPLGVALVIAPWNYPIQLLLSPVAGALAAGNCVVAKPSELAPACSAVLARLIPKYLDDEAVVCIEGGVAETAAILDQQFDHIFFTGSTRVGQVVMAAAAKHLTPVTLELGGKSPTIVAADADLDVTARRIAWGKHINAGQTCIAPDYVLAEASIRDTLVDKIAAAVREFNGPDQKATPDFSRIVNTNHHGRLCSLLDSAGGTVAFGGETDVDDRYIATTVVVDPDLDAPIMQEEIFGPLLPVLSVSSVDEAIEFINDRPKPLALYVFSSSDTTTERVIAETSSGGVCVNHTILHIGSPSLPFGGVGPSGIGAYHGRTSFDVFTHYKSVLSKPTKPDPKIMYPPYAGWKEKVMRKAM